MKYKVNKSSQYHKIIEKPEPAIAYPVSQAAVIVSVFGDVLVNKRENPAKNGLWQASGSP